MTSKIPGPQGLPVLGNLLDILTDGSDTPIGSLEHFADLYGPIYQFTVGGVKRIVCSSVDIIEELIDEKRFNKVPPKIKTGSEAAGLFTVPSGNPDWGQAHRILVPAFGPLAVEAMFDGMKDIASQLVLKWARQGPESRIYVTDDFTRLTLDTIALCTMDYRFNSFYQDAMHPFVEAMLNVLSENGARVTRPAVLTQLRIRSNAKFKEDQSQMNKVAAEIIAHRRANPKPEKDFLNAMLYDKDPRTGKTMRDELIIAQMKTFLIAGHETTSGLLSFAVLNLLKNSHAYVKAQKEVDEVMGRETIQLKHLKHLKYLNAVLRETSRLTPTAPIIQKHINPDSGHQTETLAGGKYLIQKSDQILMLLTKTHQDPSVYGADAAEFRPERMMDEEFSQLPAGAYKPFGNGSRACIGRPLAWQEATLALAMVLQSFDLQLDDPTYKMRIKQTLTIKPRDLYIRASLRKGVSPIGLDHSLHTSADVVGVAEKSPHVNGSTTESVRSTMTILYGSNTGTCQAFAQRLASDASAHGFAAQIMDMNSALGKLPKKTPTIVITSSYEGRPPDNAAQLTEWLKAYDGPPLDEVQFAVFGCGHRDWAKTFHRIPKLIDSLLEKHGAQRLAPIGLTDVVNGTMFGDFEDWLDQTLWPRISSDAKDTKAEYVVDGEISTQARATSLRHDVRMGKVKTIKRLTADGEPGKWHMEVQLPSDTTYECGDYLAVLPLNPEKLVRRIMSHFQLPWDATINLKAEGPSTVPSGVPLSIYDVLRSYVELSQPATKKDLRSCIQFDTDSSSKTNLTRLSDDSAFYESEILRPHKSLLDVLIANPSINLPFLHFLTFLPPLRLRQYSISSSPMHDPQTADITFSVLSTPSTASPTTLFEGVATTYLSDLSANDAIQISIRPTAKPTFRLPVDEKNTPLLMFCAGTGIAPFRGFTQQRAVQVQANSDREFAPALLFVGCRSPTRDRLFADELDEWTRLGAVEVVYAFSQDPDASDGCRHVRDRMMRPSQREQIVRTWRAGARVYVCGSRAFGESVREAAREIVMEALKEEKQDDSGKNGVVVAPEREKRFLDALQERVAMDIFD